MLCPDLKTEGALWFPDLTMPDGTWILPILLGVTNLLNIEVCAWTKYCDWDSLLVRALDLRSKGCEVESWQMRWLVS